MLAGLVICATAVWFAELAIVFDRSDLVVAVWIPASLAAPGVLALSVLGDAVAHAIRLGASLVGGDGRLRPGDASWLRIVESALFGALAAYTLWWVAGSLAVTYVLETGGVLLAPYVAMAAGSVLGGLVLARTAVSRLR